MKIIIFDVSPGFNQTKIKVNNEIIMMLMRIMLMHKLSMETMIELNNP